MGGPISLEMRNRTVTVVLGLAPQYLSFDFIHILDFIGTAHYRVKSGELTGQVHNVDQIVDLERELNFITFVIHLF